MNKPQSFSSAPPTHPPLSRQAVRKGAYFRRMP